MKKKLMSAMLACTMVMAPMTVTQAEEGKEVKAREDIKIGVSWKTMQEERYVREYGGIEQVCEEQGIELLFQCSENDAQKQISQIENMVSQDIDILIVQTNEKEALANSLKSASEAGVQVCYYEKVNGETYCDISGGNYEYEIGTLITQACAEAGVSGKVCFLYGDPAGGTGIQQFHDGMHDGLEGCDIEVVGEQWVTNWDPNTGLGYAENWVAQYGDELGAIFCMNDGLAGAAIQALENADLAGKVLVCGQDCDLVALQRINEGTQISTVLKSGNEYPRMFTEQCIDYYLGELTDEDFPVKDTNSDGEEVPFINYEGKVITKDNLDDVVEAGVYTAEEIYGEEK